MARKTAITSFFLIQVTAMAVLAGNLFVRALQGELSILVVSENSVSPFAATVASAALASVTTGMLVIVLVAVETGLAQLDAIELSGMAGIAMYGGMCAAQLETGISVMIEDKLFPFLLVMTLFALFAIAPAVHIVDAVTGDTLPGQALITLVGVAAVALSFLMLAVQRKFGLVMIETASLPGLDAMTFITRLAQTLLVRIILVVAVIAGGFGVPELVSLLVAACTGKS